MPLVCNGKLEHLSIFISVIFLVSTEGGSFHRCYSQQNMELDYIVNQLVQKSQLDVCFGEQ